MFEVIEVNAIRRGDHFIIVDTNGSGIARIHSSQLGRLNKHKARWTRWASRQFNRISHHEQEAKRRRSDPWVQKCEVWVQAHKNRKRKRTSNRLPHEPHAKGGWDAALDRFRNRHRHLEYMNARSKWELWAETKRNNSSKRAAAREGDTQGPA